MIRTTCPACGYAAFFDDDLVNTVQPCPRCATAIDVTPGGATPPASSPRSIDAAPTRTAVSPVRAVAHPAPYKPAALIGVVHWAGWVAVAFGVLFAIASATQALWFDLISAIGLILAGIVNLFLVDFLSRLDRATHKVLNS
jgi:hypothetical protein